MTEAEIKATIAALEARLAELRASQPDGQPDPGRRAFLAPLAALAAAGAIATASKEAKADLSMSEVEDAVASAINSTIASPIQGSFDLAVSAYSILAALGISPEVMALLQCLGLFGNFGINFDVCSLLREAIRGEGSMLTTGRIDQTMEALWPPDAASTPTTMDESTIFAFETYYQQVRGSQAVTASNADTLPVLAAGDDMQLALMNAAAANGHLIEVNARLGHLIYSTNRHLAMVIQGQNAQQQMLGSQLLDQHHRDYLSATTRQRQREPTEMPVPGPQVTGPGE